MEEQENKINIVNRVHLPIGAKAIIDSNYKKNSKKDFKEHYYYLAGVITWTSLVDQRYKNDSNPSIPINWKVITSVISRDKALDIFKDLQNWGVLELVKNYSALCELSKRYKFNPDLDRSKIVNYVIKDKLINKKLDAHRIRNERDMIKEGLGDYIRSLKELRIDAEKAKKHVSNHYVVGTNKYQQRMLAILSIEKGDFFYVMDKNGRVHTNITNLAKDLRKFLIRETGELLKEVDITNSQPLFVYCLLKNTGNIDKDEIKKYGELVSTGFYENLNGGDFKDETERGIFKEKVYKMFYGKKWNYKGTLETKFACLFPDITNYIIEQKKVDYKKLANLMQKAEADFIINKCVKEIFKNNGYDFCLSIHDSIVVVESDYEMACTIMKDIFFKKYKTILNLKSK